MLYVGQLIHPSWEPTQEGEQGGLPQSSWDVGVASPVWHFCHAISYTPCLFQESVREYK